LITKPHALITRLLRPRNSAENFFLCPGDILAGLYVGANQIPGNFVRRPRPAVAVVDSQTPATIAGLKDAVKGAIESQLGPSPPKRHRLPASKITPEWIDWMAAVKHLADASVDKIVRRPRKPNPRHFNCEGVPLTILGCAHVINFNPAPSRADGTRAPEAVIHTWASLDSPLC